MFRLFQKNKVKIKQEISIEELLIRLQNDSNKLLKESEENIRYINYDHIEEFTNKKLDKIEELLCKFGYNIAKTVICDEEEIAEKKE